MIDSMKRGALLFGTFLCLVSAAAESNGIRVSATAVPLSTAEPNLSKVGALEFRGGVVLECEDTRFGGLSALHVSRDGSRMLAITDGGSWLEARLDYDERGFLTGVSGAEIQPLLGQDGKPLADKTWADAESLALLLDGSALVGFERHHRIWRYRGAKPLAAPPEVFQPPPGIDRAPANGGLEAMTALQDGSLFALTEEMPAARSTLQGYLWRDGKWSSFSYLPIGTPRPSDATLLPNGDVLILERSYSPVLGLLLRLRRVTKETIRAGAVLDPPIIAELKPPLRVENFEGLFARQDAQGETLIYIVSDDNFSKLQKTLLLMFALTF